MYSSILNKYENTSFAFVKSIKLISNSMEQALRYNNFSYNKPITIQNIHHIFYIHNNPREIQTSIVH